MAQGWGDIPTELLIMVMSYMSAKELARLGNVNYHWKRVSEDDSLWKPLFIRDYKLSKKTQLKGCSRWIEEYKMLKYESPIVLSENLRDCSEGLTHVCFSPDGQLFCTVANNGSFKIWTATNPIYLVHERYLGDSLGWVRALYAQFNPSSTFLLVCGTKFTGNGEIAIFSVDGEECEVHFICRIPNNPPEVWSCWFNNSHLLSSEVFYFDQNSIIGTSATQIFLCSTESPLKITNEPVMCPILRLLNRNGGCCQLMALGRFISSRLRGVVLMEKEAILENKSLSAKAKELLSFEEGTSDEERREELCRRLERMCARFACKCTFCSMYHENRDEESKNYGEPCLCECHEEEDRLLIYAFDDTDVTPAHSIAFKIIDGEAISNILHRKTPNDAGSSTGRPRQHASSEGGMDDQVASLMAMFDWPDHVIDMGAHVMGFTLSSDHRYLYVNVTHDNYEGELNFNFLAETRVVNLITMSFERSYFGHFASVSDHFNCSVGGHYIASASMEGGHVWSKEHHCPVGRLQHGGAATAVAVHPLHGEMVVSVGKSDGRIKVWRSKKFLQKLYVPNDFM